MPSLGHASDVPQAPKPPPSEGKRQELNLREETPRTVSGRRTKGQRKKRKKVKVGRKRNYFVLLNENINRDKIAKQSNEKSLPKSNN